MVKFSSEKIVKASIAGQKLSLLFSMELAGYYPSVTCYRYKLIAVVVRNENRIGKRRN